MANAVVITLKSCGAALTRACVLERISHMDHVTVAMLPPRVTLGTPPTDYHAIKEMLLARFDGRNWVPLGGLIGE
jgi:hypothetical protein